MLSFWVFASWSGCKREQRQKTLFLQRILKRLVKPVTWTVDAFIKLPDDAKPGTYIVDSSVIYRDKPVKKTNTFEVKNMREGK